MSSGLSCDDLAKVAVELRKLLVELAKEHFQTNRHRVICYPSMRILGDVVKQWDLELRQLALWQPNGIRPTKSIASLSFWIKKLKPIRAFYVPSGPSSPSSGQVNCPICGTGVGTKVGSLIETDQANRIASENFENEIADINERLAVLLAIQQLVDYATGEEYVNHRIITDQEARHFNKAKVKTFLQKYFKQKLGRGDTTIQDSLLFNMRYRTFATHHIVHILDQILFALTHINDEKKIEHEKRKATIVTNR